ncbi:MAG: GNAT family N-acetyltransferase [Bacteroidetes bacterium]|nr:GNAT family N-acetyltransferase [Bacteroidota bacterium]MBU1373558.1 GNAT family N-acetyltransferase [Bacteroidota bacterium]MBU1484389.1 GNAT family N-acetyltransferase [Bacteroidota bacterium]MBU1759434.1 GNAT family N-acetyltransferase [Bacteroidota bacterium]MBU2268505.1 GNAT family N-acetyltransferase [Bacteroidota bacterium]
MNPKFKKAQIADLPQIWDIIQKAIQRRKADGSNQWQDGYPNPEVLQKDIEKEEGYVLMLGETIAGYCAIMINNEPAYTDIEGEWVTNKDFVVFHRVAIAEEFLGKGLAKKMMSFIEEFALANDIYSIKADTNFDNMAMMKVFEKSGYVYCGEVYFRGSPRKAYEKVLQDTL